MKNENTDQLILMVCEKPCQVSPFSYESFLGVAGAIIYSGRDKEEFIVTTIFLRVLFMWYPSFGFALCLSNFLTIALDNNRCVYFPSDGESLICVRGMRKKYWNPGETHCCSKYIFNINVYCKKLLLHKISE